MQMERLQKRDGMIRLGFRYTCCRLIRKKKKKIGKKKKKVIRNCSIENDVLTALSGSIRFKMLSFGTYQYLHSTIRKPRSKVAVCSSKVDGRSNR